MTRCDYDAVFYRVFCVTLLAVAFTFTIILTNVFIDIDGLLAKKHDRHNLVTVNEVITEDFTYGPPDSDDLNYGETDNLDRTKRSIESKTMINNGINIIGNEQNANMRKDNVPGLTELRHKENVKLLKFLQPEIDSKLIITKPQLNFVPNSEIFEFFDFTSGSTINIDNIKETPNKYLNVFVTEYSPKDKKNIVELKREVDRRRRKRHVKIKFLDKNKPHLSGKDKTYVDTTTKKKDDELYIEIETHFDSKGMKGKQRRNLIKHLIAKIQKAVHSGETKSLLKLNNNKIKKKLYGHFHVKKRTQDPLKELKEKIPSVENSIIHRHINPFTVSKSLTLQKYLSNVGTKSGEAWKEDAGPTFLTGTKSINSAEMRELKVDYSRVLGDNGIPQRLQKPLNTDMSEETMNANSIYDLGNMKFFIKDIDGSGFSIGYNQYVDEQPDSETMKLFTSLESIIKAYQQNYAGDTSGENADPIEESGDMQQFRNKNNHIILRRSISEKHDSHTNEYNIYDRKFLPRSGYKDIYDGMNSKTSTDLNSIKYIFNNSPIFNDQNNVEEYLDSVKLFDLANLLQRKKRFINVKRISNIKNKIKLRRYLKTNTMATKKYLLNKRHKRQINKIRIIASDYPQKDTAYENIFVVSDENLFANRATMKEVSFPEEGSEKFEEPDFLPHKTEEPSYLTYKIFDSKFRRNPLMVKYPHILMEEIAQSKEEFDPTDYVLYNNIPALNNVRTIDTDKSRNQFQIQTFQNIKDINPTKTSAEVLSIIGDHEDPKTDYKVTVKMTPKNTTGLKAGFKEIHTSINKTFNKNGLIYSSLVNVSEISKITKINKNATEEMQNDTDEILAKKIKNHQEQIHLLLRQHQKYVNEQLLTLSEEKKKLDAILVEENSSIISHSDHLKTSTSNIHKHLTNDLTKSRARVYSTINPSTIITSTVPTTTTLQSGLYTEPVKTTLKFTDNTSKNSMLGKIENNEHLTNTILQKIDKNTEVLQSFLKKLIDKIDNHVPQSHKGELTIEKLTETRSNVNPFPINWKKTPFDNKINESYVSMPFHYGYQQPSMFHKNNAPLNNLGYQGPVDTNSLHNKKENSPEKKISFTKINANI